MTFITAVVCVHNQHDVARRCIDSLAGDLPAEAEILVIDDASRPRFEYTGNRPVTVLRNPRRQGYTRSANRGLRASTSDIILLANSDTVFPSGSVAGLVAVLENGADLCSPLSNAASWQSVPAKLSSSGNWTANLTIAAGDASQLNEIVRRVSRRDHPRVPLLNGFCLAMAASVLNTIGYFDESCFPTGYGEEDDFCIRAGEAGFRCVIADDVFVFHEKSMSFGHLARRWHSRRGGRALNRKWGRDRIDRLVSEMRDNATLAYMRDAVAKEWSRAKATRD